MPNFNCRYHENELPELGDLVVCKISDVSELGVYVKIIEYNNIEGLIVVGEQTRKRIYSGHKQDKIGTVEVLYVSMVDTKKKFVDLSRLKVTPDEKVACLAEHYNNKLAHNIMITIAQKVNMDLIDLYNQFGWPKAKEYNKLYNYFIAVKCDPSISNGEKYKNEIVDSVNLRIKITKFKVSADIAIGCYNNKGVMVIKRTLLDAMVHNTDVEIVLVRPPVFSVLITTEKTECGIEAVENTCSFIKKRIESLGGYFEMKSKPMIIGTPKVDIDENSGCVEF